MGIKIGLDFGASRVKVSFINQKGDCINFFIPNRVDVGDSIGGSGYVVEYNGQVKRVGAISGTPNMQKLKINYEHLEEILLAVTYQLKKEQNTKKDQAAINVCIETLLPPKQFFTTAYDFKDRILGIKELEGVINDENLKLVIDDVSVNCEGVALVNTLDFNSLAKDIKKVLLIDVGSSTIDPIEVIKVGDTWNIGEVDTFEFGGTQMCKAIEKSLITKYKSPFQYDEIERTMAYTYEQKEYKVIEDKDCLKAIDSIVETFKIKLQQFKDHKQYQVVLGGDGSELLYANDKIKEFMPNAILLPKEARVYGNSMGALHS